MASSRGPGNPPFPKASRRRGAFVALDGTEQTPRARQQIRSRPPAGQIKDTRSLPRLSDGAMVINYRGPYVPACLQVILEIDQGLRHLKYSRQPEDEMALYAEIKPGLDHRTHQVLLGAIRGLSQAGELQSIEGAIGEAPAP